MHVLPTPNPWDVSTFLDETLRASPKGKMSKGLALAAAEALARDGVSRRDLAAAKAFATKCAAFRSNLERRGNGISAKPEYDRAVETDDSAMMLLEHLVATEAAQRVRFSLSFGEWRDMLWKAWAKVFD